MILPRYKDITDLIKKGATLEAQEKIIELREGAIELQEENFELKDEIRMLKNIISKDKSLKFEEGVYWLKEGESVEGPFCPKCYDTTEKMVRMHKDGDGWWCYTCKESFGTGSESGFSITTI